jgi:hypothetical protein
MPDKPALKQKRDSGSDRGARDIERICELLNREVVARLHAFVLQILRKSPREAIGELVAGRHHFSKSGARLRVSYKIAFISAIVLTHFPFLLNLLIFRHVIFAF